MTEQPALSADVTAGWVRTIRDLVKAERERDEALAALARVRTLVDQRNYGTDVLAKALRGVLEGP